MKLHSNILTVLIFFGVLTGCADTVTKVDYVETDTYLSSYDSSNHSTASQINVSRTGQGEERGLFKIPTGDRDSAVNLQKALEEPGAWVLFPFYVLVEILEDIFDCKGIALNASNLTNAKLVVNVLENQEGSLSNKLSLQLITRPWWQSANWQRAHYFSSQGKWDTQGGDLDSTFSSITGTVNGSTVEFDVTNYFRTLIATTNTVHYGMILKTTSGTMNRVTFESTQSVNSLIRPRLVSTYSCSSRSYLKSEDSKVFYLGGNSNHDSALPSSH